MPHGTELPLVSRRPDLCDLLMLIDTCGTYYVQNGIPTSQEIHRHSTLRPCIHGFGTHVSWAISEQCFSSQGNGIVSMHLICHNASFYIQSLTPPTPMQCSLTHTLLLSFHLSDLRNNTPPPKPRSPALHYPYAPLSHLTVPQLHSSP